MKIGRNNRFICENKGNPMNTKEKQKYKDNLTNNNHKQRKSLIAYFDILGYKEMIKTNYIPENILIGEIERITKDVYNY